MEAATAIMELEFALTQLQLSIDEFMNAMQYAMIGKVPVNLISPTVHEILQNVTLVLPECYELVAGIELHFIIGIMRLYRLQC
jgi:uncharacterized membrane protein (DUF2068 family)